MVLVEMVFSALMMHVGRVMQVFWGAIISSPLLCKCRLVNIWRCVYFYDCLFSFNVLNEGIVEYGFC